MSKVQFFKPEDVSKYLDEVVNEHNLSPIEIRSLTTRLNQHLEREGKRVFLGPDNVWAKTKFAATHQAILINIAPIESQQKPKDVYSDLDRETLLANMEGWISEAKDLREKLNRAKEGLEYYATRKVNKYVSNPGTNGEVARQTLRAIEPISKCEHPIDKIRMSRPTRNWSKVLQCECGARVKPSSFVEET